MESICLFLSEDLALGLFVSCRTKSISYAGDGGSGRGSHNMGRPLHIWVGLGKWSKTCYLYKFMHSLYYRFTMCDSLIKWQTGNDAVHIWTKYSDDRKCYFVPLAVHIVFSLGFSFELRSFLSYTWPLFWPNSERCGLMTVRITESFSREPAAKRKSYLLISFLDRLEGGIGICFAGFIQLALP